MFPAKEFRREVYVLPIEAVGDHGPERKLHL
jgi:hypothetical protein